MFATRLYLLFRPFLLSKDSSSSILSCSARYSKKASSKKIMDLNNKFGKIMRVKYIEKERKVALSVRFQITETSDREFNLNRDYDEPLSATFAKLYANYQKQVDSKVTRANKKQKKEDTSPSSKLSESVSTLQVEDAAKTECPIQLLDHSNSEVLLTTTNQDAWKEDYKLVLNSDQSFQVCVNLPHVRKLVLPGKMIAGMPAIVKMESDSYDDSVDRHSTFKWFYSKQDFDALLSKAAEDTTQASAKKSKSPAQPKPNLDLVEWVPLAEGVNNRMVYLTEATENRLIKVVCTPSDGKREGIAAEYVSTSKVEPKIDLSRFAMNDRHKMTKERLSGKSLRVMSYNILAGCYSDTAMARNQLYPYCSADFLDFGYRRLLLIHEILNYNSDIIFLQECEKEFFDEDLMAVMPHEYELKLALKGETREGEAILFRSDRFKLVESLNLNLSEELTKNPVFEKLMQDLRQDKTMFDLLETRATTLQVVVVESKDQPGRHLILANTHLFFHPEADFIRLIQSVACVKFIEKKKYELQKQLNGSRVDVLFAGDFNSDPGSFAFTYVFTHQIPVAQVDQKYQSIMAEHEEQLMHSLELATHVCLPFTNCIQTFECVLDYVFYEQEAFELKRVIPLPSEQVIKQNVALPSEFFPSDHLPIIFEMDFKP